MTEYIEYWRYGNPEAPARWSNEPRNLQPGTRCPTCDRRVNKPRQATSPESKTIRAKLPTERARAVDEALDALQAYTGADATSYPRGSVLEALVLLGGQHREELKAWFSKEDE